MSDLTDLKWEDLTDFQKEIAIDTLKEKKNKVRFTREGAVAELKKKTFEIVYDKNDDDFEVIFN